MKVFSHPLRPARAASLLATVLLVCVFLCGSVAVHAGSDDLPTPEWSFSCKSPFQVCSTVETYRYWNENPKERLHFAVDGLVKDVNNKKYVTVWLLMDEPNVEFAKELARADFYVMMVYPRGTQLSTTHYTCTEAKPAYTDQCWLTEKCAAELAARSAKKDDLFNASHFTADQVAHDVEWLMRTLGDGRPNVLVTQGLSSVFAMRMLQLHPQVPVGVIMMDQVNPVYFDTYGYLGGAGFDVALQHLLAQCDDDALCVGRLGAMEGTWARLQTLVSLAKGNKLTCAKKLSWGGSKQLGSSFADQLRSVLALMMRFPAYPFVASKVDLMSLIPSMLYRLQRCAEKDIKPLNTLYSYVTSAKSFTCPVDVPVQTNWLVNDFLQSSPPKSVDKYWAGEANRRTVQPALMSSKEFNTVVSKMPSVARTNLSRLLPVNATQKILFLSADLDPMAPRGTASVAAVAFRRFSSSVRAVQLRGITNAPAEALTPCLLNNLRFYKEHREWADADTCTMDSAKQLDFLNGPTKDYYGVGDGWDFDLPNNDDGSSRSSDNGGGGGGGSVLKKIFRVLLILIVIAAVGAGGYYGYFYFKARGFRYNRVSDNFYDNLQT